MNRLFLKSDYPDGKEYDSLAEEDFTAPLEIRRDSSGYTCLWKRIFKILLGLAFCLVLVFAGFTAGKHAELRKSLLGNWIQCILQEMCWNNVQSLREMRGKASITMLHSRLHRRKTQIELGLRSFPVRNFCWAFLISLNSADIWLLEGGGGFMINQFELSNVSAFSVFHQLHCIVSILCRFLPLTLFMINH